VPRNGSRHRAGYEVLLDINTSNLDAVDFVSGGDDDYTIAGETFTVANTGAATTFGITGNAGSRVLRCVSDGTATTDDQATETAPRFELPMGDRVDLGALTTVFAFVEFSGTLKIDQRLQLYQVTTVRHGAFLENDGLGLKLGSRLDFFSGKTVDPSPATVTSPDWLGCAFQALSGIALAGQGSAPTNAEALRALTPSRIASWSRAGNLSTYPHAGKGVFRLSFCPVVATELDISISRIVIAQLRAD